MFDPVIGNHAEFVERLYIEVARCNRVDAANAFLASLSSRRLDWRSALGSYAVFHLMKPHTYSEDSRSCGHCGMYLTKHLIDLNILNFERIKWGGVRHSQVEYALLDLTLFNECPSPVPTSEDFEIFRELIDTCRRVEKQVTSSALHKHLPQRVKGNKAERDILIAILGLAGILAIAEHPGFASTFIPVSARELPNRRFVDMSYPTCWWSGEAGVNEGALAYFFGHVASEA